MLTSTKKGSTWSMTAGGMLMKEGTALKNKYARFSKDDFFYLRP